MFIYVITKVLVAIGGKCNVEEKHIGCKYSNIVWMSLKRRKLRVWIQKTKQTKIEEIYIKATQNRFKLQRRDFDHQKLIS